VGAGDGTVQGLTTLLNNGPAAQRLNVVLVAEGFQASELSAFADTCDDFVTTLQAEAWFPVLGLAVNVYRLDVASNESGADDPSTCGDGSTGSGVTRATFFDATFCNAGIRRCLSGNTTLVRDTLDAQLPQWHVGAVLVNTSQRGGCANGDVFWTALSSDWREVVLHELGHAAFGLGDEYDYWAGCGTDTDRDTAPVGEPSEPNVTTDTTAAKWRDLLTPGAPVPTMTNPDCTQCDRRANVLLEDTAIGLYEGAQYYHCGRFRPAYTCKMRDSSQEYCRVCLNALAAVLGEFIEPDISLEVEPTSLDFGDVPFAMTMFRAFTVRNRRGSFPGAMSVSVTAPPAPFALAPGTPTSFTLPAPVLEDATARLVFVSFTAPTVPGTGAGSMSVSSAEDPGGSPVPVNLIGRAIEPPPVDSVLALDRSGSMSEPASVAGQTKTDYVIDAANLYVTLLKENDRIGLVRFNDESDASDVLLTMTVAGPEGSGAGRQAAWAALTPAALAADGFTSIGAGMINGSGVLDGGTADARALVVLTDGIQNTNPDVLDAIPVVGGKSPRQRVFAVGLGLNQLEDTLQQIASVTNGVAQITGDLVADKEFLLQKLYVQILADAGDEAFVRDPSSTLLPGQRRATTVLIGEVDVAADFVVVFRAADVFPKYLRAWLEAPDGSLIQPGDQGPGVNMTFHAQPASVFFRVTFPVIPANSDGTHAGRWRLWVENLTGHVIEVRTAATPATSAFDGAVLTYATMVKARSDLRLDGRVVQPSYQPGSPMTVVLEPTLYGLPVTLDPPVRVTMARPDGVSHTLTLSPDGAGAYRADTTDTGLIGAYLFTADVGATTPQGTRVTRYRTMTGIILRPGGGAGGGGQGGGGQGGGGQGGGGQGGGGQGGGGHDCGCGCGCRHHGCAPCGRDRPTKPTVQTHLPTVPPGTVRRA
jgi:uncharacterized membrane protein YgcG